MLLPSVTMLLRPVLLAAWLAPQVLGFQSISLNLVGSRLSPAPSSQLHASSSRSLTDENPKDRRSFFLSSSALVSSFAAVASGLVVIPSAPAVAAASSVDYKAVAAEIQSMIQETPDKGPTLVRLAWHSSGTYDKMTQTGGSAEGTIRFKEELAHGGNAGLADTAVQWMEPLYTKYGPAGLSYADLYTLGGVAAIRTMGGPTIPWSAGRVDALDAASVTPDGRLPNADSGPAGADPTDAAHLRAIFNRMGFNDQVCVSV